MKQAEIDALQIRASEFLRLTDLAGLDQHTSIRAWLTAFAAREIDAERVRVEAIRQDGEGVNEEILEVDSEMRDDDFINNDDLDEARECLHRRNCMVQWDEYESSVVRAMAAHRAGGGNYRTDDDTYPTRVWFANGRTVGIAFDGDKPYLTIGYYDKNSGSK